MEKILFNLNVDFDVLLHNGFAGELRISEENVMLDKYNYLV